MLDAFSPLYMQRALLAVMLLAIAGGLLGAWVVLRGLAFFSHAVGTATLPGTVIAGPWGIAAPLAATGSALVFCVVLVGVLRERRLGADAATGLLVVAALALGSILASDVYPASAGLDTLLFGTVLGIKPADLTAAALTAALAVGLSVGFHRTWAATGFDGTTAVTLGVRPNRGEWALLGGVTLTVVAMLPIVGALLAATLLVVPAATARLVARSVGALIGCAVACAITEGVSALWVADRFDLPPGPVVAVLAGAVYAAVAGATALQRHPSLRAAP